MAVSDCIVELVGAKAALEPQLLGLQFFDRLDQDLDTHTALATITKEVAERLDLVTKALDALQTLTADGYPENVVLVVDAAVLEDLDEDLKALNAAKKHLEAIEQAVSLGLTATPPEPK